MIEMYKDEVRLDKPIYVGTTILDLSKLLMMRYHYEVIEEDFKGRYNLLYSDTDSLVYEIFTPDVYEWMKANKSLFDLSDSIRPDMKDKANKKVLGKVKDEFHDIPIQEFISLNPKVYSVTLKDENVKKLKGVSKAVVKNEITHDDYGKVLDTGNAISKKVTSLRSCNHQLYTIQQEKIALTAWYDKMAMLDRIHCVPFGYEGKI